MQVYDGTQAHWREDDKAHPVNMYGQTKLEAEQLIQVRGHLEQGQDWLLQVFERFEKLEPT